MKKTDSMLLATFFSTCFYSATYPYIYKVIMSAVTENAIAVNQIAVCISVILFSSLWNRFSNRLYPFFQLFCVLESIAGVCTSVYVALYPENVMIYYILDTLMFCLITRNIICGGVRLRAVRYKSETEREHFDNSNNSVSAMATIIGSLIALKLNLDFTKMIWIAAIGNMIDNIFYILIFEETKKRC